LSAIRADDIDVYLRTITYEEAITRGAERFIQRAKWAPQASRFKIYDQSVKYYQVLRNKNIKSQKDYSAEILEKGQSIIDMKKLGDEGNRELG
jgi:hypothetical protein